MQRLDKFNETKADDLVERNLATGKKNGRLCRRRGNCSQPLFLELCQSFLTVLNPVTAVIGQAGIIPQQSIEWSRARCRLNKLNGRLDFVGAEGQLYILQRVKNCLAI